jgi:hypothetical protein
MFPIYALSSINIGRLQFTVGTGQKAINRRVIKHELMACSAATEEIPTSVNALSGGFLPYKPAD